MSYISKVLTYNRNIFTSISHFTYIQTLGQGSFGSVQLYKHNNTQQLYAIKIIESSTINSVHEKEGIEREIRVHSKFNHQFIVKLYDCFQENDTVYMILEYLPNGNLFHYIQTKQCLSEEQAINIFGQVCTAINYLHSKGVFHRDIKPENILLDENFNIKLCDFGWCAENIHQKRKTFCGTYEYMAPEIILETPYDYSIDLWSLGILLFEMLHGYAPFTGKNFDIISQNIVSGQYKINPSVSKSLKTIINGLLQKEPQLRLQLNTILSSSIFRQCQSALTVRTEPSEQSHRHKFNQSEHNRRYLSPKPYLKAAGRYKSPNQSKLSQQSNNVLIYLFQYSIFSHIVNQLHQLHFLKIFPLNKNVPQRQGTNRLRCKSNKNKSLYLIKLIFKANNHNRCLYKQAQEIHYILNQIVV